MKQNFFLLFLFLISISFSFCVTAQNSNVIVVEITDTIDQSTVEILKESIQRKQITLEKPSGDMVLLLPESTERQSVVSIHQTDESGIYKLYEDNSLIQLFAVQSNSLESDFTPIINRYKYVLAYRGKYLWVCEKVINPSIEYIGCISLVFVYNYQ